MSQPPPPPGSVAEQRLQFEARGSGLPFLFHRDTTGHQRILLLDDSREHVTVGRDERCDIVISDDKEVSRLHAQFDLLGESWVIVDDGLSRNGTFVNGERISGRRRLRDGDAVRVGSTLITFAAPSNRPSQATVAAAELPDLRSLSEGQRQVLIALCRPYKHGTPYAVPATNQAIADELYMSVDTVKTHLRSLFAKFEVGPLAQNQKRAKLVEVALRLGVVSDRDL